VREREGGINGDKYKMRKIIREREREGESRGEREIRIDI